MGAACARMLGRDDALKLDSLKDVRFLVKAAQYGKNELL